MFRRRTYSLRQSRHILHKVNRWYRNNASTLSTKDLAEVEKKLEALDQAVLAGERRPANDLARELELFSDRHIKKGWLGDVREVVVALLVAFTIALVVRQCWWELYQIPSGSMRPTYREVDHLIVSKTALGINLPMVPGHLYFDPGLVQRTGVVIFTGHNLDMPGTDDWYFKLIPYKKRFIKRLIGKPGDSLYFYGGRLHGVDREGKPIADYDLSSEMAGLEHIPFNRFEGRTEVSSDQGQPSIYLRQFGRPLAKVAPSTNGRMAGQIAVDGQWKDEGDKHYYDFFGIENYAMARLLNKEQVLAIHPTEASGLADAPLYLELRHHPKVKTPELLNLMGGRQGLQLPTVTSLLPLQGPHIEAIRQNLYTNRFVVEDGYAHLYGADKPRKGWTRPPFNSTRPQFPSVPDGKYELYYGEGLSIGTMAYPSPLAADHPLLAKDPEMVQSLFNVGIEMSRLVEPQGRGPSQYPSRYAYFRDGDLYLMGGKIMGAADPVLQAFVQKEAGKTEGFVDLGAPDTNTILKKGIKVPEKHYMVLGDNHAYSADSRFFGFVPEENLRGSPTFLLWPPGGRWGAKSVGGDLPFNWGSFMVWGLVLGIAGGVYLWQRRRNSRPCFEKIDLS